MNFFFYIFSMINVIKWGASVRQINSYFSTEYDFKMKAECKQNKFLFNLRNSYLIRPH